MTIYVDPTVSSGGSGTSGNPYSPSAFATYFNALTGDLAGESILIRSGTFMRAGAILSNSGASNYTVGVYGTGSKPVLSACAFVSSGWTYVTGNIYSIPHTRADSWFLEPQSANGIITSSRPYGTKLTQIYGTDLATAETNGLNLAYTTWFDSANNLSYVNLGGLDPNQVAMAYSDLQFVYHPINTGGSMTVDGLIFANSWDGNGTISLVNDAVGLTLTDLESYQGCSPAAAQVFTNFQVIGSQAHGHYLTGLVIDNFVSKDGDQSGFDLLYCKAPEVRNLTVDNCCRGLGLWNDVVDGTFRRGILTNFQPYPNFASLYTQTSYYGLHMPGVGSGGVNGNTYRNRFEGYVVANSYYQPLFMENGGGTIFDNCAFIGTTAQTSTYGPTNTNFAVSVTPQNTYAANMMDVAFNNCVVLAENGFLINMDNHSEGTAYLYGDNNIYVTPTAATPTWENLGSQSHTLATWQAAIGSQMDAHSTYLGSNVLPGFTNAGTMTDNPLGAAYGSGNYLSGLDVTPQSVAAGNASDSPLVGAGGSQWKTNQSPPTLAAGDLTASAGGTLAAATYYVKTTFLGPRGETLPSGEQSLAVSANNVLNVASPASPPSWAIGWNVYVSTSTGTEERQNVVPIAIGTAWVEPTTGLITSNPGPWVPTVAPPCSPPESSNGTAFYAVPDVGAVQHYGQFDPYRQKRASGGW